ncbi:hypothetical protein [Paenibacillus sp. MMS18-CY102]|uniref:hypothetical protein n=1 Tax=Paenibacillus sp. MMS18-CY102 TaxID=2682849 RepID=UPI001365D610|nr:hypothetical protein [Paenibacillus sp. MMS18-CY102]MWC30812.1 hypothetical protein [Paenibacillus sp. MMS18-CY102]
MKRMRGSQFVILLLSVMMVCVTLAGCGTVGERQKQEPEVKEKEQPGPAVAGSGNIAETKQDDFIYRLIIEPAEPASGGDVKLYGELEYVGDQDEIDIHHAASPFFFYLKETTRGYNIGYMMNQPAITTKLKKGAPLREQYKGGGGFSDRDNKDYIAFIKDLSAHGFPVGHYEVTGTAEFFTGQETSKHDYKITAEHSFDVAQASSAGKAGKTK